MPSILNSDDGVVSGTSGLKSTGGNDGLLNIQSNGSTVVAVTGSGISVTGTVSQTGVSTFAAGTASAPSITFTGDTNTGIFSPAADTIAFTEGGVESMRINSSGNVGIGTTSPSHRLHVVSSETANPITTIHATNASYDDYNLVSLATRNTTNNSYYFFRCRVSGVADRLVVADSGSISTAGSIQLGDAGAPPTSGVGVKFPATQSASSDANTLDDYEEGTFDVTVTMGTSGTCTVEPTYNKMRYTKIGQMVTIQGQVLIASVSSPVGEMRMSLPFSIGNADEGSNLSGCVPRLFDVAKPASGIYPYVYVLNGNNYMVMSWVTDNSATINHVPAAGDYFIINFSYFI